VSPEEDVLLKTEVRLSGLTKQDYIIKRLQCQEITVYGNPKVYKALKNELETVLGELRRLNTVPQQGLLDRIDLIVNILREMKGE
jgi:hypothetical protein